MKKETAKNRFQEMEEDVYIRLDRMKRLMDRKMQENQKILEALETEVDTIKRDVEGFGKIIETLKQTRFESLHRDMESLKTKLQWIEERIENLDHQPIIEKIKEMEDAVKILKASSPIVIE